MDSVSASTTAITSTIGWYGKLPALGDFAGRRLPESFIRPWDQWLANSVMQTKQALGEHASDALLTFPIWRFVLPRRLIDDNAWLGAMLPSVDRVGRCFPLTVALPLPESFGAIGQLGQIGQSNLPPLNSLHAQLKPLVEAALRVVDDDDVEAFDAHIIATSTRFESHPQQSIPSHGESLNELLLAIGARLASSHLSGESLWWSGEITESHLTINTNRDSAPGRLFRWPGQLDSQLFARLLEG